MDDDLVIRFAGETMRTTSTLTFGRGGDLELDTNPFLHRHTGAFVRDGETWWLHNTGSTLYLTVAMDDGTRIELSPGARQALTHPSGVVRIVAARSRYEIEYTVEGVPPPARLDEPTSDSMTAAVDLRLTPREVDVLVSFARPVLLGLSTPMPTYVEVASMWSISPKTLDNTLQSIKRKFRANGLGRDSGLGTIVATAVHHSVITRDDLEWAEAADGERRPSADGPRFR